MVVLRSLAGRVLAAVVCVVLGSAPGCERRGAPCATLTSVKGSVTLQRGETTSLAEAGAALFEGDVVVTGADSEANVAFAGGNSVRLGPHTSLAIKRAGGTSAQLGAVLLSGTIEAASQGLGVRLGIGTPFGLSELGAQGSRAQIDVSTSGGLRVLLGSIEVVGRDGARTTLAAGGVVRIDGLVVPLSPGKTLVLEPLTFVLAGNSAQVQVKRAADEHWRAAATRETLASGDAVRTRRANATRLELGERARVVLDAQSELTLGKAEGTATSDYVQYALASGAARLEVERGPAREAVHEVTLAGQTVRVEPGAEAALVEVRAAASGRGQVTVRLGRATLANGSVLEAGWTVSLDKGTASELRPLAATDVEVGAGTSATVYYPDSPPPLRLSWDGAPGPYDVELASDRQFKRTLWRERVSGKGLVVDDLKSGRYYWRVRLGQDWKEGVVVLERGRNTECKGCKRTNVIDDSGENTVVYFQKTLPAIALRWSRVNGAARYRVKLFANGAFDTPLIDTTLAETTLSLPAGKLAENEYFWLVQSLAADGKEVAGGKVNGLDITYDNAVNDLDVRTPAADARVSTDRLVTAGEVRLGSKLYINGKAATLDKKGRFSETLSVARGENRLVFRTVSSGIDRFYLRRVYRR